MSTLSSLTNRFAFLARWFRRQDEFDHGGVAVAVNHPHTAANGDGDGDHNGNGKRPGLLLRRRASRERNLAQLQQAYEEVVELVHTLKQHMDAQSERSERLLTMMEGLPEALKSLPEANRNQTQTLQAIEGHLKQQTHHSEGLTQAIQGLAKAAGNQEHAMGLIQQQLDAGQTSREQMHENFTALGETLRHMSESNQAATQLLTRLNDKHEQSDTHMQQMVARNQRQMTVMSIVSWSLAIVALGVAAAVAISVGQQTSGVAVSPTTTETTAQVAGLTPTVDAAPEQAASTPATTTETAAPNDLDALLPAFDPYADLLRIEPLAGTASNPTTTARATDN